MHRRNFIEKTLTTTLIGSLAGSRSFASAIKNENIIKKNSIILFTGDSITDASRVRELYKSPNKPRALGTGYVNLVAAKLYHDNPNFNLKIYNTGINGNTIEDLNTRWETDCLMLEPTIISILVGVNDFNVSFSKIGHGNAGRYENEYRDLLCRTRKRLSNVQFVIGEPFALKGVRDKIDTWYPEFEEYKLIAKKIANEFNAIFIPYQKLFDEAILKAPDKFYSTDGIHPSLAGIELMKNAWLKSI